jgi:RNA polymerase sigma factor (sigma-70 family)
VRAPEVSAETLARARGGELAAVDAVLAGIQPAVYNLAVRMLGNREDAQDACQEILLKVITHLGSFRGDSAFGTWVYRVASNHLLTAISRASESPAVSFESLAGHLEAGVSIAAEAGRDRVLLPDEKLEAKQKALSCTQHMLMCLDRDHRLAYVLDVVFGLASEEAAAVLDLRADAYRKRLSRARARLQEFMQQTCGLVGEHADCRCEKQVYAARLEPSPARRVIKLEVEPRELQDAERHLQELMRMSDAAAVIRGHPEYRAPPDMIEAIRAVLRSY